MKISTRVALAAAVALGAIVPASANNSWNGYHWATRGSGLSLRINTSINEAVWDTSVGTAISDWDNPVVGGVPDVLSLTRNRNNSLDRKRCSPLVGQALVCNYTYGRRGWLGIATIWLSNGHISQATTKLNDSYFNSGSYNDPRWRALVACQEIGHDFGLDHQDENFNNANLGTCMDYTNNPTSNQHPNAHDYEELGAIYLISQDQGGHDDGYTSATASAAATDFGVRQVGRAAAPHPVAEEAAGDTPGEWGRAVRNDGLGRPDVFIKDIAPGRKMVTHVFWTLEAR